jgi:hypothetical protein
MVIRPAAFAGHKPPNSHPKKQLKGKVVEECCAEMLYGSLVADCWWEKMRINRGKYRFPAPSPICL